MLTSRGRARMLDGEANGRSQWLFSLRVACVRPGETTARSMVIIWTDTRRNGGNGLSAFVLMLKNFHVKHDLH